MGVNATNALEEAGIKQWKIIVCSLMFGIFQFVMPTIGYFLGQTIQRFVEAYIPWIAFALLGLLAVKSFVEWFLEFRKRKKEGEEEIEEKKIGAWQIFVEAIATSIDALCIGFAFMYLEVGPAMLFFGIIGCTTFLLSYLAALLAKHLAGFLKNWAGLITSIVFLGVGLKILLEGLLG